MEVNYLEKGYFYKLSSSIMKKQSFVIIIKNRNIQSCEQKIVYFLNKIHGRKRNLRIFILLRLTLLLSFFFPVLFFLEWADGEGYKLKWLKEDNKGKIFGDVK